MAEILKNKEGNLNNEFYDYFTLSNFNNYEELYIINDEDFNVLTQKLNFSNIVKFENKKSNQNVNDFNPIFLNLKLLNNTKIIYLKEKLEVLNDESIKNFISSFKGIIITSIDLVGYLKELNLIKEDGNLKPKTYLKFDKFGIKEENRA
jgi:hypothetical protein